MSDIAIRVENLSKRYRIGARQKRPSTLRESLQNLVTSPFAYLRSTLRGPSEEEIIWALKDVSFEVKQGEVIGIIGRNGAGKSTLLKILSRITEPTTGRAEVYGRVGSLLEVGTGFHPELTGRENIYLNGAILGMRKREIDRKFDEIVAFAEVEKFIDTPVKHYSSGMYVRLAFAVAAHLEPEILLVDEVLAVGDAAFQKKCLGKMGEVAKEGRTVLFVSHNMGAIRSLCQSAVRLESGQVVGYGDAQSIVVDYLTTISGMTNEMTWHEENAPGNNEIKLIGIRVYSEDNDNMGVYSSSKELYVEMEFDAYTNHSALCVGFDLVNSEGVVVTRSYHTDLPPADWLQIKMGRNRWRCIIPPGLLNAGVYYVCPRISMHYMYWIVDMDAIVSFELVLDHGASPFWVSLNGQNRPGIIAPILQWKDVVSPFDRNGCKE